jgi:membrane protein EpsK
MKRQIFKNVIVNGFSFICNVVIALLLTPFLVNSIGVAAYGLIPLAMFFTEYIGLITQSLTSSVNRTLTISIQKGDISEANTIFNTSFFMMVFIAFAQLLLVSYPISQLNSIISIPEDLVVQAKFFFLLVFINFTLSLITSIFSVSMYSANRLDLMQISNIIRTLIRAGFIVTLFSIGNVDLITVGIASLVSGLFSLLYSIFWWRKLTPNFQLPHLLLRRVV